MTDNERRKVDVALHLNEECSELIVELGKMQHALTKFLRHGETPFFEGVQYDNIKDVRTVIPTAKREINDVQKRIDEFEEAFQ